MMFIVLEIDPWDTLDLLKHNDWSLVIERSNVHHALRIHYGIFLHLDQNNGDGKQGNPDSQKPVAFIDFEAANAWWRMMSTPPSVHAEHVKRISPHLYVKTGGGDLFYSTTSTHKTEAVSGGTCSWVETLYSPLSGVNNFTNNPSDRMPGSMISTDHISGRWYFVRSKEDPSSHWYLRTSGTCAVCADNNCGAIHASSEYRTRFCVRVRNLDAVPLEDFVMIRKDEISISAPRGYILYIDEAGDLKAKNDHQGETDLLFGDLNNRFITRAERQVNGETWEYVESVERDVGEPWELA